MMGGIIKTIEGWERLNAIFKLKFSIGHNFLLLKKGDISKTLPGDDFWHYCMALLCIIKRTQFNHTKM
jgi:hypothetical protein